MELRNYLWLEANGLGVIGNGNSCFPFQSFSNLKDLEKGFTLQSGL